MRGFVLGVMMMATVPTIANASGYSDTEGDWKIAGVSQGYGVVCLMISRRPADLDFLYMVAAGPGPARWAITISTKLPAGPVDGVINVDSGEPIKVKGLISKGTVVLKLKTDMRDSQTTRIRDALSDETAIKITLNRAGTPPEVMTPSLSGASDALLNLTACVRQLGGLDD